MPDDDRERQSDAPPLPPALSTALADYRWARDLVGESGAEVYALRKTDAAPDLYLKHATGSIADAVTAEMERLQWLAAYLPVPQIVDFARTPDHAWLLTTALPGRTAFQCLDSHDGSADRIVDALATFLRRLHAIPVVHCPFDSDPVTRLVEARARIDAGLVDEDDFDDVRSGWSAEHVWTAMQQYLPFTVDPVVTHGDFSLDNLMMNQDEVVGCLDVGRLGIADRYQDLAILWNGLAPFGAALQDRFLRHYGVAEPDHSKIAFHLLLDELF